MSTQNLIIYKFTSLYHIFEELGLDLNFKIFFADSENSLNDKVKSLKNCLIISNKKHSNINNQFILEGFSESRLQLLRQQLGYLMGICLD